MKINITLLLLVLLLPVSIYISTKLIERHVRLTRIRQENVRRQMFIQSRLDAIGGLMEDKNRTASELERDAAVIINEIEVLNDNNVLTPLIADTRSYVAEKIAKR